MACLCAPTSHEGSFRCRLHRAPNPIINSANPPIMAANQCLNSSNSSFNPTTGVPYYAAVRGSSTSTAPMDPRVDENGHFFSHFPQAAADRQYGTRCMRSSLPSEIFAGSSVSSSSSRLLSYRQTSKVPSSFSSASLYASSSSSRASASSSSRSPTSPFSCMRPQPVKRPSSSSPPKCPYRASSPPVRPTSWCGSPVTSSNSSANPNHAAAVAIMRQHALHSKRMQLRATPASKIGPSRLSRMAVACLEEHPVLKEEDMSDAQPGSISDTSVASASVDTSYMPSGHASVTTAHMKAAPIGLKMRSSVTKFKQSESSCRVVGSNKGSLIMPTVY